MNLPTHGGCVRTRYQKFVPPSTWDRWPRSVARVLPSAILIGSLFLLGHVDTEAQPLDPAARIAAGAAHSLALAADGTVWAWGENGRGQLGDGTTTSRSSPVRVSGISDVVAVSAGGQSSYAVKRDGTLWAWGFNQLGSLGDGTTVDRSTPVQVLGLSEVTAVSAGTYHALALDADGTVWSWGLNSVGQLGDGTSNNRLLPAPVGGLSVVRGIAAGGGHSLAVEEDGTLWAWGANGAGQLGIGSTADSPAPALIPGINSVTSVVAGMTHSVALRADGTVWSWGGNAAGQLGDGTFRQRNAPAHVKGLPLIHQIAAGYFHSFAVGPGGTVWAWGLNLVGALGDGTWVLRRKAPAALTTLADVAAVVGGGEHSLALTASNIFYGWGFNAFGEVGDGTRSMRRSPVLIQLPESETMKVAAPSFTPPGGSYSSAQEIFLSSSTPGSDIYYTTDGSEPTPPGAFLYTAPIVIETETLVTARAYRDGWTPSDTVSATYQFNYGTLTPPNITPEGGTFIGSVDVEVSTAAGSIRFTLDGSNPTADSTLYVAPITLTSTTTLKAAAFATDWTPSPPASADFVIQVAPPTFEPDGGFYTSDQTVVFQCETRDARIHYTTNGDNPTDADPSVAPGESILITEPLTLKAKAYAPGTTPSEVAEAWFDFGVATPKMIPRGGVYWRPTTVVLETTTPGAAIRFTTDGSDPDATSPLYMNPLIVEASTTIKARAYRPGFADSDVKSESYTIGAGGVAAGGLHSLALWPDGTAWSWGANDVGQLGDDVGEARSIPGTVPGLPELEPVLVLSAGELHSLALAADGTIWAWGDNASGQLGDGTTTTRFTAAPVSGLADIVAIAAGGSHSLALSTDGNVWAWGENSEGQLGDGTTTPSSLPVLVVEIENVVAIAAGASHSLALKGDGSLWAWGSNAFGQLGDGGDASSSVPVQVILADEVDAFAAGGAHSLAVTADGTLWAWGDDSSGQLGTGNGTSSTPARVVIDCVECSFEPFVDARAVSAGRSHSLALKTDGTVWAWGEGSSGEIGDGDFQSRSSPVPVNLPGEMLLVAAGGNHNLALATDGTVWAWGGNDEGQIGDGTTDARPWPVAISEANLVWKVGTPVFGRAPGEYREELELVLTTATPGALIHFTTDGSEVTEASDSIPSGGSVAVDRSMTVRAIAFRAGQPRSNERMGTFTLAVASPVLTPPPGSYDAPMDITVTAPMPGVEMHYAFGGVEPTEADPIIASGGQIPMNETFFLRVKAFRPGWEPATTTGFYALQVLQPTLDPPPGVYETEQDVTIHVSTLGAVVRYTTDGRYPSETSPVLRAGDRVHVARNTVLTAVGFRADLSASEAVQGAYSLRAAAPVFSPPGGGYAVATLVNIASATPGTVIRYTVDGSEPGPLSLLHQGSILIDASTTIKARAFRSGWLASETTTGDYAVAALEVSAPTFSPAPGAYATSQTVTIACATPGAVVRYTTNGLDPTELDPEIASGSAVTIDRHTILKAKAWATGESPTRSGAYLITGAVSAGFQFTLALKADGTVWAWGANDRGQLGDGAAEASSATPVKVPLPPDIVAISAGGQHALALSATGSVWAWGDNTFGQVGDGTFDRRGTPVEIGGLPGIRAISAGANHSLALGVDGRVRAWGRDMDGELGNGVGGGLSPTPILVASLGAGNVVAIEAGLGSSFAIRPSGAVFGWGSNHHGKLGLDLGIANSHSPLPVPLAVPMSAVAGGDFYGLALSAEGTVAETVWHLGSDLPAFASDLDDALAVSANGQDALVLRRDRRVLRLRLGDPRLAVPVAGVARVLAISAGNTHFVALRDDGSVWSWGSNGKGELGDGTQIPRENAAPIAGLRLAENVAAGNDPDFDFLSNAEELYHGTDPLNPDTNGDRILDGVAVALGLSPTNLDMDGDSVRNAIEIAQGTDPFQADTDGDGAPDGTDCAPLNPTVSVCPTPDPGDHTPPTITLIKPANATLVSSTP